MRKPRKSSKRSAPQSSRKNVKSVKSVKSLKRAKSVKGPAHAPVSRQIKAIERAQKKSALYRIIRLARKIDEEALRRASEGELIELKRAHLALLPHLDAEGTRITALAERLGVTKQAVSQTVAELEALGLLERAPDPSDGRARLVMLTEAGWERIALGLDSLLELERSLNRGLPRGAMAGLNELLDRLDEKLDALAPSINE